MLRKAKVSDIKAIHGLIDSYSKKGEMLPCALVDLYERMRDFYDFIDDESGEIIRQIPPDDVMELKKTMGAIQGLVLDKKA